MSAPRLLPSAGARLAELADSLVVPHLEEDKSRRCGEM